VSMTHTPAQEFCSAALFAEDLIRLHVDLLFVSGAQLALMLHLRGASLRIPSVTGIRHWVFALFRQSEFLGWLCVLLRGCKFCHSTSPAPAFSTLDSFAAPPGKGAEAKMPEQSPVRHSDPTKYFGSPV
jgi:hypothetical protein